MDYKKLIPKIFAEIKKTPVEVQGYKDLFSAVREVEKEDVELAHKTNKELRELVAKNMAQARDKGEFFDVYKKTLLFDAPLDFDSYMLYMEIDRPPQERFYQPRRKKLKVIVDGIQALVDDELDELFISQAPRTGKSTLALMFVTWLLGKDSERSNLYSAFSDTITKAFYNGVLEIINDNVTYKWHDVFPKSNIVATNSQEETIDIDRRKRYHSLTCRSLYGTLNGATDCNGVLISDDLIGGIEEALNKDRMMSAWQKCDNNLLTRAKAQAKIIWIGTRWSIIDPIGIRIDLLQNDPSFKDRRVKVINVPALDENDESNFDYDYGVGFSTEYFKQRRASFEHNNDMPSWDAQYMGQPVERSGTLFEPNDFRYFNGELPEGEPDRVFMAVDPAFGGGDYVAAPICYKYGNDIYVVDVVYDNNDKKITQPLIAQKIVKHNVKAVRVEANKSTEAYKEGIEEKLKEKGYKLNITTKAAPTSTSKIERIYDKAPDIRDNMIFLESGKRDKAYNLFMQNVFGFKLMSKNQHDDAPDSLAMAIDMVFAPSQKAQVFKRTI